MAVRRGRRETFFSPEKVNCESRGLVTTWTPGTSASMSGRMVFEPIRSVSLSPRWFSRRSVKTWPRSRSLASWTSSTATNDRSRSRGIASMVDTQ